MTETEYSTTPKGKLTCNRKLPLNAEWKGYFLIVDPWMGCMGNSVFYWKRNDYLGGELVTNFVWVRRV
jgi:hypothetical protein